MLIRDELLETKKMTRLKAMMNVQEAMDHVAIFLSAHKNDESISDSDFDLTSLRSIRKVLYNGVRLAHSQESMVWAALLRVSDLMIMEEAQASPHYWLVRSIFEARNGDADGEFPCLTCGGTIHYVVSGHSWNPNAKPIRAQCDGYKIKISS